MKKPRPRKGNLAALPDASATVEARTVGAEIQAYCVLLGCEPPSDRDEIGRAPDEDDDPPADGEAVP